MKIKSKAILALSGLMVAAFMLFGAVSASADMITLPAAGVSKTSSITNIQALQTFLNWTLGAQITPLVVDGVYGAKTTAAIRLFQQQNGLSADGRFGPISAAKAMALQANMSGVTYPVGCTSNSGYSSATGQPCSGGALPAGCSSTMGYSSTTGIPCSTPVGTTLPAGCTTGAGFSSTTGQPCTVGTVNQGTNGYLADISSDSTNRVSTVYESEQDKVVAGFRATARLASQTITRVRVTMCNDTDGVTTNGVCVNGTASSNNLAKYISSASLWYGSTKIATMAVAQADRGTSNDVYTFNFSGLNANIAKDQIGRFYVSVSANGSMDSNDTATAKWVTTFTAGGISANSPDGSSDTYPSSDISQAGLTFGKFSSSGVKAEVNLSSSNPSASVVTVQNTSATNNVNLLKFTIKATNSDLTLRKIPIQVTATGNDVVDILNTLKLYRGTDVVDTVDGSSGFDFVAAAGSTGVTACTNNGNVDVTCTFYFSNLSNPGNFIAIGTTAEFTVVADIKAQSNFTEGDTLSASLVNLDLVDASDFSVQDVNGDQLPATSAARIGSAVGQVMTLRINGVQVVMGSPSYTVVDDAGAIKQVTYIIPLTATAFGNTLYTGQTVTNAASASDPFAFSYSVISSSGTVYTDGTCGVAGGLTSSCSATFETSDAATEGSAFRLDSGIARHFTIKVTLVDPEVLNTSYRVRLNDIRTYATSTLTSGTNQALLPVENYQTGYQLINN